MAELFGKDTGCARGLGGSMHFFDAETNFMGGWGIVGGHLALAAGAAFKSKYTGDGRVSICFFGEGAMNQGAFYESLNLASLWKLPAVFVIENNQYAMGTPLSRASAISDLASKASAFGMEGEVVDGMDVTLVHACIARAAKRAREERRPTLVEARCYRFRGHSMSDPAKYRTKDEVEERKTHDPIALASHTLVAEGWATQDELDAWDEAAKEAAADASEFAIDSPQPGIAELGSYVYADPLGWKRDDAMTPHVREEG
jgi:pyruvate dehydrogenase E1 component alpha subunit